MFNSNMKKNFENPRWRPLERHSCGFGCHGNQLDDTWSHLIGSTRKLIICAKYQVNRMNGVKSGGEGAD